MQPRKARTVNELIGRVFSFEKTIFPNSGELFAKLSTQGQSPKALMISCADSRIVPEQIRFVFAALRDPAMPPAFD